jgi:hypothetical protein
MDTLHHLFTIDGKKCSGIHQIIHKNSDKVTPSLPAPDHFRTALFCGSGSAFL